MVFSIVKSFLGNIFWMFPAVKYSLSGRVIIDYCDRDQDPKFFIAMSLNIGVVSFAVWFLVFALLSVRFDEVFFTVFSFAFSGAEIGSFFIWLLFYCTGWVIYKRNRKKMQI